MARELNEYGNPMNYTVRDVYFLTSGNLQRCLMRWSDRMAEYVPVYAADHFTRIVEGLRVWDYDMKRGAVSLSNVDDHDGWFDVVRDDGQRKMMNGERVVPKHPRTGEAA